LELVARDQLGDIVGEGFDLAIWLGEPRASTLIARKLWDTVILTVAAPSYLKRRGQPETLQELESGRHSFLLISAIQRPAGISNGSFIDVGSWLRWQPEVN
jgi:DNA-binding transcriptional LysR family regulator